MDLSSANLCCLRVNCLYIYIWRNIYYIHIYYYKDLVYMIMGTDKSQDLQSASWRPWRASGIFPVWMLVASRPRKSQYFCSSLKARKKPCPRCCSGWRNFPPTWGVASFFVLFSLQVIGLGPPTLGRAICFTQSTHSNGNLFQKHPHRPPRIMFDQMSGTLWLSLTDTQS